VEALLGAMSHSAAIHSQGADKEAVDNFVKTLRSALHNTFRYGQGTRDMVGPKGLTTEQFIDKVAWRLGRYIAAQEQLEEEEAPAVPVEPSRAFRRNYNVDKAALKELFSKYDKDNDGTISITELEHLLSNMGVAPLLDPTKRGSASSDINRQKEEA
jgi:hypothetical protein